MKLTGFFLACMAVVVVQSAAYQDRTIVDKTFLKKQQFFFEILRNVGNPLMFEEWLKHGERLVTDETHYTEYNDLMTEFYEMYKAEGLLEKGEFFSIVNRHHMRQASGLFSFFYHAKDWDTLIDNAVWARINVNQGMFVYALTLTVIHRDDLNGIMLPTISEIFPQMFFNSKLVLEAEKFDWELWNKQIMYEKQWMSVYEKKHVKNIHSKHMDMKDWKTWQWWKLMGLDEEWHLEEKCILRDNIETLKNDSKWTALWNDMKMVWMPVDYSRDIEILNEESKLSYFTEDLGWNEYWYYLNMDYAMILNGEKFDLKKDRRGEWWIYNVQQMLARYYMERLSNGLGEIGEIAWHGYVNEGYDPKLIAYNGVPFTRRMNFWEVQSFEKPQLLSQIMSIDQRINDAIAWGKFTTKDGAIIDLWKPESVEMIGNIMQGNMDILDRMFFDYWLSLSSVYLAGGDNNDMTMIPNVFLNHETLLRDPLSYHLLKRVLDVLLSYRKMLPSHKREDLNMKSVTITEVKVDKLMTYYDLVDSDVTNIMNQNMMFENGKFLWDKMLLARQMRLNHKPFNTEVVVTSAIPQTVMVRMFLGPAYDEFGRKINLMVNSENLMELDAFSYELVAGENVIKRSSKNSTWTINDRVTYSELYKLVMMAYEGKNELLLHISEPHCGFPSRLVLPRGWSKGMPMKMFVMITPYTEKQKPEMAYDRSYSCGIGTGSRHLDTLPFGFPFDREMNFLTANMFWKDVKIYHVDKFEKYYDHKYDHFGTFDYNFY